MSKFICCPECNYQYLPGEIFNPKYFIGQPKNIIRNNIGEILGYEGIVMDPEENFICENCGKEFLVTARLSIVTKSIPETNENESESTFNESMKQVNLF